jgi:hypothetical protein
MRGLIRIDPLLLEVSLRENLDPEGICSDADIWLALEKSQVGGIKMKGFGLD